MKVIELLKSKEWSGKVIDCVLRFALSFALAGAQVFGGYAPLALGMIGASGAGLRGVSALIGASAGAVLFLPFSHALRTFAAGVLIFTANNAFFDLKLYKKRAFLPLLCAGMMFSVEFVYVLRDGVGEAANCLMALLLCALGAMSGRALLSTGDKEKEDHPYAPLFILLGVLMAASSFETADGFAPGRILSMLAVLLFAFERGSAFAIPAALCIGLGMDLGAGGGSFVHAASYAFSAVLVNVDPADFGSSDVLAGVQLQRSIEQAAFRVSAEHGGKPYEAPAQRVGDFLGTGTAKRGQGPQPTYARGVVEAPIAECFPKFVSDSLAEALPLLGRKLKGFDDPNALMTAPETRSSSPVRICRGRDFQARFAKPGAETEELPGNGVFPCGEGPGYAGGIMSAACDGLRVAAKIAERYC